MPLDYPPIWLSTYRGSGLSKSHPNAEPLFLSISIWTELVRLLGYNSGVLFVGLLVYLNSAVEK